MVTEREQVDEPKRNPDNSPTRRSIVKNLGFGVFTLTPLGTGAVKADLETDSERNDGMTEDESVEPDVMTNATTKWGQYTVQQGDTVTLESTWSIATPLVPQKCQFDILVDCDYVWQPDWIATNLSTGSIEKDWEYMSDVNALDGGPAYHFKAVETIYAPLGTQIYVTSKVETCCKGTCTAQTGTYAMQTDWSGAKLTIE